MWPEKRPLNWIRKTRHFETAHPLLNWYGHIWPMLHMLFVPYIPTFCVLVLLLIMHFVYGFWPRRLLSTTWIQPTEFWSKLKNVFPLKFCLRRRFCLDVKTKTKTKAKWQRFYRKCPAGEQPYAVATCHWDKKCTNLRKTAGNAADWSWLWVVHQLVGCFVGNKKLEGVFASGTSP